MPVNNQTIAPAKEVFHDIKPLPEFHPLPLAWIFGLLILLLLYLLYRQRKKSSVHKLQLLPGLSPKDFALEQLKRLNEQRLKKGLPLRELSSSISLVQRTYLEKVFNFNACEQTVYELNLLLPQKIRRMLPHSSFEIIEEITDQLKKNLRFLELISFGNNTADIYTYNSPELISSLESVKEIILAIESQFATLQQNVEKDNGI